MVAHETLQLEDAFDFLLGEVVAQRLAKGVIGGGVKLVVETAGVGRCQHGEERFAAVKLALLLSDSGQAYD
jgi:hypothetical protein